MFPMLAVTLTLTALLQQPPCQVGQVVAIDRSRDYTLNVCGIGVIALRGVEPPLRVADGLPRRGRNSSTIDPELPISGEVLGNRDVGPEAVEFLRRLLAGKRVTIVEDGWRIGDPQGRRYAYAFLADKTHVNAELIERGLGYADRLGSHPRRDEFFALEGVARRAKVGVWAS